MALLQLAEGNNNGDYEALADNMLDNYIYIPANFLPEFPSATYVRADYFVKNYPADVAENLLTELAPLQNVGTSVLPIAGIVAGGISLGKKLLNAKKEGKPILPGLFKKKKKEKPEIQQPAQQEKSMPAIDIQIDPVPKQNFFQRNKTPILIGAGAIVLLGGIYLLTRKKRK